MSLAASSAGTAVGRSAGARARDREARTARLTAAATLVAVLLAALGIGLHQLGLLTRDGPRPHRVGDDVSTSFGIVAVEFVRSVDGVTSRALAGASHGVSGLVDASHTRIQVAVAITNRSARPIHHRSRQFTLLVDRAGRTQALKPAAGDLPDTRVLPDAGVEGHLDFTIPRKPVHLSLRYRDPGRAQPIVIDLGNYRARPVAAEHQH